MAMVARGHDRSVDNLDPDDSVEDVSPSVEYRVSLNTLTSSSRTDFSTTTAKSLSQRAA